MKYRRQNIKDLFSVSERFGFKYDTVHLAVAIYDNFLHGENAIEDMRNKYTSCKGVISEQLCTFIASLSLFMSAKYVEIKYPVVEDVCQLM